ARICLRRRQPAPHPRQRGLFPQRRRSPHAGAQGPAAARSALFQSSVAGDADSVTVVPRLLPRGASLDVVAYVPVIHARPRIIAGADAEHALDAANDAADRTADDGTDRPGAAVAFMPT